jgi:hypothetical protein
VKEAAEMVSGGKMYLPSFMKIGSGNQVTLTLLPQEFERQQCWYY